MRYQVNRDGTLNIIRERTFDRDFEWAQEQMRRKNEYRRECIAGVYGKWAQRNALMEEARAAGFCASDARELG